MLPNPSLERTATGLALGPLPGVVHHPYSGPSAIPASARSAQTLGLVRTKRCPATTFFSRHSLELCCRLS